MVLGFIDSINKMNGLNYNYGVRRNAKKIKLVHGI